MLGGKFPYLRVYKNMGLFLSLFQVDILGNSIYNIIHPQDHEHLAKQLVEDDEVDDSEYGASEGQAAAGGQYPNYGLLTGPARGLFSDPGAKGAVSQGRVDITVTVTPFIDFVGYYF